MRLFAGLLLLIGSGFVTSARADLTIVQRVDAGGQNGDTTTVKIKGDKERVDSAAKPTQIIDGKAGEMIDLINDEKKFVRISADQIRAAAEAMSKFDGGKKQAAGAKLNPTGKKETINGYETEEYLYETQQYKASFWVAKKYPDSMAILKEMQVPLSGAWKPSNIGMPDYTDFPGLPLRTVISAGGNQLTTTIVSIDKNPVNAADFEIPKDFEELKKPIQAAPAPSIPASPARTP